MSRTIGAYYQVYTNKKATDFVLKNFRLHFPDCPVMLISDGGENFSDLADKYNCGYTYSFNIFGNATNNYPQLPYSAERMLEAWRRHKLACDYSDSDYILILEDDVYITKHFSIEEDFALRGARIGNNFTEEMIKHIVECGGKPSRIYGMCGGSIYNAHIFKDIYQSAIVDIRDNHDGFLAKSSNWFLLGAIDANITYHYNLRGFTYEPSPWLVEKREATIHSEYPIIHQYKDLY
jgi:hypothetical protein